MEDKRLILVVDDSEINREILKEQLKDTYNVIEAHNGEYGLQQMRENFEELSLVLLDIMMPDITGFQVLERMKANSVIDKIPVILITEGGMDDSESRGLMLGAVDYITKPLDPETVTARVSTHIRLKEYRDNLEELVAAGVAKLDRMFNNVLQTLAGVIEYRDLESGEHVQRTKQLAEVLLLEMKRSKKYNLSETELQNIIKVSPLHDIGKIGISDSILLKPGKLTPEEYEEIKKHTTIGEDIAKRFLEGGDSDYVRMCREVCRHHHEKWNGTGYPDGLKGAEIPISARVVSIVDVFDALVSSRVYKKAMSFEEALVIIKKDSGVSFDPDLVEVFMSVVDSTEEIYKSSAARER